MDAPIHLEIWSDIACPFCYIGKRQLDGALAQFEDRDQVAVSWRSFQLAPDMPRSVEGDVYDHLARKFGRTREEAIEMNGRVAAMAASVGLEPSFERVRPANTRDAHRLIRLAPDGPLQQAVVERLFRAYFVEGAELGDRATLERLGAEAGLEPARVAAALDDDALAAAVAHDTQEAHGFGLTAVPAFVFDRRFAVSGAQGEELLLRALEQARDAAAAEPQPAG